MKNLDSWSFKNKNKWKLNVFGGGLVTKLVLKITIFKIVFLYNRFVIAVGEIKAILNNQKSFYKLVGKKI